MVIISIILLVFFSVLFLVLRNNKYINSLEKEIKDNYQVKEEIKYLNKFDLYYIIVTTDNLIVLDNDYQEVFKDDVSKINKLDKDYEVRNY